MKAIEFGLYLRNLRKENNLSIRQLAERSNVSNAYLSQVENGKRSSPSPEILKKLSEHLNVSYDELMNKAGYIELPGPMSRFFKKSLEDLFELVIKVGISEDQLSNLLFGEGNTKDKIMKYPYTNKQEIIKALSDSDKSIMISNLTAILNNKIGNEGIILIPFIDNSGSLKPENNNLEGKAFVTTVVGDSVKNSRINEKDTVLVKKQSSDFKLGDIVVAIYEDINIFRRIGFTTKNEMVLISDNINEPVIPHSDKKCRILGKVVKAFFALD